MNTRIGTLFLALLIGMAGIVMPSIAEKDNKLDPDPLPGGEGFEYYCGDCGNGVWVYNMDIGGIPDGWWNGNTPEGGWNFWKTTNTACIPSQCGIDEEGEDNLVDPKTVGPNTFQEYPAQEDCEIIDGRLPSKEELAVIYANRAILGNNFAHMYYWSSTEYNDKMAYYQAFRSGRQSYAKKDTARYIRCVRDGPPPSTP